MTSMRPAAVYLEESEKEELQQLIKGHSTPQQIAIRARIIVLAGEGGHNQGIAEELDISRKMVRLWRGRWLTGREKDIAVVDCLRDVERSGAPPTFELVQDG